MTLQEFSSKSHILVVDDDERIRKLVSRYLWDHDFIALEAEDATAARESLDKFDVDAIVLDVMMPGETGIELTQDLRKKIGIPILLLTALGEVASRIDGLESGADDYLPKPFEPKELVARLKAILRRSNKKQTSATPFKIGAWHFDPDHNELRQGDKVEKLTSVETTLIKALASQPGAPMSRDQLAELCNIDANTRTLDVQVTRLRRKIEEDTKNPRYLQTVRGKGYLLRIEDL